MWFTFRTMQRFAPKLRLWYSKQLYCNEESILDKAPPAAMFYVAAGGAFDLSQKPPALLVGKKLKLWTEIKLPDILKLRSVNLTQNIEEVFKMKDINSLEHTKWRCQYHIVFAPKYRRQVIYREIKADIGFIIRKLCEQKGVEIIEANACPDQIHMLISIPPKYSVAQIMGYLKGKSSLMIFDRHANLKYKYGNRYFWARGLDRLQ